jgi:hypothetical protein
VHHHPRSRAAPDRLAQCGVAGGPQRLRGEIVDVPLAEQQPGLAVGHHLARGGNVAGEQRAAAGLRFEVHARLPLGLRGHHHEVCEVDVLRHVRIVDPSREAEPLADGHLLAGLLHRGPQRAITDDHVHEAAVASERVLRRVHEIQRTLDRLQVRGVQDDGVGGGDRQLLADGGRRRTARELVEVDRVRDDRHVGASELS